MAPEKRKPATLSGERPERTRAAAAWRLAGRASCAGRGRAPRPPRRPGRRAPRRRSAVADRSLTSRRDNRQPERRDDRDPVYGSKRSGSGAVATAPDSSAGSPRPWASAGARRAGRRAAWWGEEGITATATREHRATQPHAVVWRIPTRQETARCVQRHMPRQIFAAPCRSATCRRPYRSYSRPNR